MARTTGIEWTDATWNPIRGCSRVSEGCRHCYAETVANRFSGPGTPYEGLVQLGPDGKGNGKWNGQIKFVENHLLDPLRMKGKKSEGSGSGLNIFVNSMSDLFHENVTEEMLDQIFAVMALCPQHTFQVLTKRPERMLPYLTGEWHARVAAVVNSYTGKLGWHKGGLVPIDAMGLATGFIAGMPLPNVQLGVSVENQDAANTRIPLLLQTPAAVRFISAEPLLGLVDLRQIANIAYMAELNSLVPINSLRLREPMVGDRIGHPKLDWVIVGGESGAGARPMHPDWARILRDQCVAADVPFFFKQWGGWEPFQYLGQDGTHWLKISLPSYTNLKPSHREIVFTRTDVEDRVKSSVNMRRVGKKAAGDLLDGVQWHQFPKQSQEAA